MGSEEAKSLGPLGANNRDMGPWEKFSLVELARERFERGLFPDCYPDEGNAACVLNKQSRYQGSDELVSFNAALGRHR
jgi:hypothetical protein